MKAGKAHIRKVPYDAPRNKSKDYTLCSGSQVGEEFTQSGKGMTGDLAASGDENTESSGRKGTIEVELPLFSLCDQPEGNCQCTK
jgi:hypothetical protein